MKTLLLLISFLFVTNIYAQLSITENSESIECGRIIHVEGIWIDNGEIKADISIFQKKSSKPITGGYKMGDTIDVKSGCRYFIKLIEKFGLNSNSGYVVFSKEQDISDYLAIGLSTLRMNDKFSTGGSEWMVTGITKDEAQFKVESGLNYDTVRLKKNDMIWKGFEAYYISDIVDESTDKFYKSWKLELKQVKDYSYLQKPEINDVAIDKSLKTDPIKYEPGEMLIIRKMRYYPKQKLDTEEYMNTPVKYWVLRVYKAPMGIARQMIEVEQDGPKVMLEYDAYKSFDTEEEVMEFAKVNGVTDVVLEEK
jgi:hypothetical protein